MGGIEGFLIKLADITVGHILSSKRFPMLRNIIQSADELSSNIAVEKGTKGFKINLCQRTI